MTSPEDQVLRKLDRYRQGDEVSDRQWREVLGILLVCGDRLDFDYLRKTADELDLRDRLDSALEETRGLS